MGAHCNVANFKKLVELRMCHDETYSEHFDESPQASLMHSNAWVKILGHFGFDPLYILWLIVHFDWFEMLTIFTFYCRISLN